MPTLILSAPDNKAQAGPDSKSFIQIYLSHIGPTYAIPKAWAALINPGCNVVLLDKIKEKRAEGKLQETLIENGATDGNIKRYDVKVDRFQMVPYMAEQINKHGVGFIPD